MAQIVPPDLLGSWWLRRRLLDRRLGEHGGVVGTLTLASHGSEVRWLERGELCWQGRRVPVFRELRLTEDEDGWQVRFADGRAFHPWRLDQVVHHPCRDDLYCGLIRATRERLRTLWDVTGPGKDQRILTSCTRR
jgi:hypothetical protein